MTVASFSASPKFPKRLTKREAKTVEAAQNGYASLVLASGKIFVGNASNVTTAVTPSGDVTISNAGVTAIGAGKVLLSMLAAGVTPSHIIKFVRTGSTSATLSGVATGDLEIRVLAADNTVHVIAAGGTNTLGSAPAAGDYSIVIRAVA